MSSVSVQRVIDEINNIVQNSTYDTRIMDYMNDCLMDIVYSETPNILLPDLHASETLTTDTTGFVELPADYCKNLYSIQSANQPYHRIIICQSYKDFLENYKPMNMAGSIEAVVVHGSRLYYQQVPSMVDALTIYYYREPDPLVMGGSVTILPRNLAVPLLANYVAQRILTLIAKRDQSVVPMISVCADGHNSALLALMRQMRNVPVRQNYVKPVSRYF
jgi:hypothetical protein